MHFPEFGYRLWGPVMERPVLDKGHHIERADAGPFHSQASEGPSGIESSS
jgi:hypothetical protein